MSENKYFTLDFYESIIRNYKSMMVKDIYNHTQGLILRHDVDMSLDLAFELSRIEHKNSVLSTYYILISSDTYNPFSSSSQTIIKTLIKEGFEIGLHFDPAVYCGVKDEGIRNKLINEKKYLEEFYDYRIASFSVHNPSFHNIDIIVDGLINASHINKEKRENYISDSSFSFRDKDVIEYAEKSKHDLIQYLTHPIHFFSNGKMSYELSMNKMLNSYYQKIDNVHKLNILYKLQRKKYKFSIDVCNE